MSPKKPHHKHTRPYKSALGQWQDHGAADALNGLELESQATRGRSITSEEGREVLAAPKIVGDALAKAGEKLPRKPTIKPSGPKAP